MLVSWESSPNSSLQLDSGLECWGGGTVLVLRSSCIYVGIQGKGKRTAGMVFSGGAVHPNVPHPPFYHNIYDTIIIIIQV